MSELRSELQQLCRENGAVAFGACRLADVRTDDFLLSDDMLARLPMAISLAMRVSPAVLGSLENQPNLLYEHHYRQVNFALDRLTLALTNRIQALGHQALPIPASQLVDWQNQRGHLSHKRIAVAAGLGWLGRNNLLVTPEHGAQVRLVTVLTDLPVGHGREPSAVSRQPFGCGSCRACISACPAHAIGETPADFNHQACFEMLKEFQRKRYVAQYICGLCVHACAGPAANG
jgi:epoxyqueuosine reductase